MSKMKEALSKFVNRVFNISYGEGWGTAFLLSDKAGSFFVTAKHVVSGLAKDDKLEIRMAKETKFFTVSSAAHSADHDLSIFALGNLGTPVDYDLKVEDTALWLGDSLYFLGFPHSLANTYPNSAGFLTPLVRSAVFSGVITLGGRETLILDGFNNPGYSGAPVIQPREDGRVGIVGIVTSYRVEQGGHASVYERSLDGAVNVHPSLFVRPNSGMIYVVSAAEIKRLRSSLDTRNPTVAAPAPTAPEQQGFWITGGDTNSK